METVAQHQTYFNENPHPCPCCDGNDHTVLGCLGRKVWLRCDSCGWEFYRNIENEGKMSDVGARIMGGMTKPEARSFLAKMGYSAARIAKIENQVSLD